MSSADTLTDFNPIALATGGFIYEIRPKAPLPISVTLQFVYSDLNSNRTMNFTSDVSYSNDIINHVAYRERVPYDHFAVKVALVHADLIGPFHMPNSTYSKCLKIHVKKS